MIAHFLAFFTPCSLLGLLVATVHQRGAHRHNRLYAVHHASHHFEPKRGSLLYEAPAAHAIIPRCPELRVITSSGRVSPPMSRGDQGRIDERARSLFSRARAEMLRPVSVPAAVETSQCTSWAPKRSVAARVTGASRKRNEGAKSMRISRCAARRRDDRAEAPSR